MFYKLFILILCLSACTLPNQDFKDYSKKTPKEKALLYSEIGLNAFGLNRYYKAEKYFRLATYYLPQSNKIKYNLALTLISLEQYREARLILFKLNKIQPKNVSHVLGIAKSYSSSGDYEKAISFYKIAVETLLDLKDFNKLYLVYRNLSEIYYTLGFEEQALCYSYLSFESGNKNLKASHLALMSALNMYSEILENKDLLEQARQAREEDIIFWYTLANYATDNFKESYFLARVIEAEIISEGNIVGFDYVFDKLKNKIEYTELSEKSKEFEYSELERNYWPRNILVN